MSLRPGSPRPRSTPLKRTRIKPRNAKRKKSEFARCFGSAERVAFVKSLPCVACPNQLQFTQSVNAHIEGDGAGRRASYTKIIPLCFECHGLQHAMGAATFAERFKLNPPALAAETERAWQAYQQRSAA